MLRIAFAFIITLHGLIHLMGFAKAFGLAELPNLTLPISRAMGLLWLLASLLTLGAVAALFLAPGWWWALGALALFTSQAVIVTSWDDAKFGTLADVLLLVGVVYGFAARGPMSLRAEFERDLTRATPAASAEVLTEADLAPLPEPVQRYVRSSGAVGQPRVRDFRLTWTGRIRADPDSAWMPFTAEQLNTLDVPRRFFMMDATMKGLPVDVLHAFDEQGASMRVKLLSLVPMVDARGPDLTRTETVTLFNDLCLFAPAALASPSIAWEPVDAHTARARFTLGVNTIGAELTFDDAGQLVDFGSDDRLAVTLDGKKTAVRWTTPVSDYARRGPVRVATKGQTLWHPDAGSWSYGEFELQSLDYNTAR
jgi:hypothetical protein